MKPLYALAVVALLGCQEGTSYTNCIESDDDIANGLWINTKAICGDCPEWRCLVGTDGRRKMAAKCIGDPSAISEPWGGHREGSARPTVTHYEVPSAEVCAVQCVADDSYGMEWRDKEHSGPANCTCWLLQGKVSGLSSAAKNLSNDAMRDN